MFWDLQLQWVSVVLSYMHYIYCVLVYGAVYLCMAQWDTSFCDTSYYRSHSRVSRETFICYFAYSLLKASYCISSWTILSYVFRYKCSNWLVDIWFSRKYCVCHPSDSRFIVSFSCSIKCSILVKINMIIFIRPVYLLRFLFSPCRYHLLHCIPSFYSCCPESIVKL